MVKASHSVRDSDSQNLDFILSEKNQCPVSGYSPDKISKERDKRQNFVQSLRKVAKKSVTKMSGDCPQGNFCTTIFF